MFFPAVFIGNFPGRSIQDTNTIVLYETFPAVKKNPLEYHGQNLFSVGFYSIFKEFKPEIVYTPSRVDFHPEHQRVAYTLAKYLVEKPIDPNLIIRIYQIHVPLTPVLTNLVVDTSSVVKRSIGVLKVYRSQISSINKILPDLRSRIASFVR